MLGPLFECGALFVQVLALVNVRDASDRMTENLGHDVLSSTETR